MIYNTLFCLSFTDCYVTHQATRYTKNLVSYGCTLHSYVLELTPVLGVVRFIEIHIKPGVSKSKKLKEGGVAISNISVLACPMQDATPGVKTLALADRFLGALALLPVMLRGMSQFVSAPGTDVPLELTGWLRNRYHIHT